MAHQSHNIPWSTLASHFGYFKSYHHNPQRLDLFARGKQNQAKDIAYFARALSNLIREFSDSERKKYESRNYYQTRAASWLVSRTSETQSISASQNTSQKQSSIETRTETRKVLPDDVLQKFNESALRFSETIQGVEYWMTPDRSYAAWIGGGDAVKILMMEAAGAHPAISADTGSDAQQEFMKRESMETLLLMTNHPRMEILSLKDMHWGHHFGVSRVAEEGLKSYLLLNLLFALREQGTDLCQSEVVGDKASAEEIPKPYMNCASYKRMLWSVAGSYDGDGQTLVHRWFFSPNRSFEQEVEAPGRDVMSDINELRDYLKSVWRILVIYDVVIREAGGDPNWETECLTELRNLFDKL